MRSDHAEGARGDGVVLVFDDIVDLQPPTARAWSEEEVREDLQARAPELGTILSLLADILTDEWARVVVGVCIDGAIYELGFAAPPRLHVDGGFLGVSVTGHPFHFHLSIEPARELDDGRRRGAVARVAFFRGFLPDGPSPRCYGLRMWNHHGAQLLNVFFARAEEDRSGLHADDACIEAWTRLRGRYVFGA